MSVADFLMTWNGAYDKKVIWNGIGFLLRCSFIVKLCTCTIQWEIFIWYTFGRKGENKTLPLGCNGGRSRQFTWKHACFCAVVLKFYMKAQKHACFHVFSSSNPLHHNDKGFI